LESILFLAGDRLDTRASNGLSRARGKGRNESALGQGARCCFGTRTHVRAKVGNQPSLCPSKGPPSDVWGRPGATRRCRDRNRDTPTRVGTTIEGEIVDEDDAVHQHARGDDDAADQRSMTERGTPPRAWGRPILCCARCKNRRYTPTRVGTTCYRSKIRKMSAVHPHARGDDRS